MFAHDVLADTWNVPIWVRKEQSPEYAVTQLDLAFASFGFRRRASVWVPMGVEDGGSSDDRRLPIEVADGQSYGSVIDCLRNTCMN